MTLSTLTLGRHLRLALLLLMLAAQGIVNAHELVASHSLESDPCTTCLIGHGLGSAVGASHATPPVPIYTAQHALYSIADTLVSRSYSHFARAPPRSQ